MAMTVPEIEPPSVDGNLLETYQLTVHARAPVWNVENS
jgi:hypothetical protein